MQNFLMWCSGLVKIEDFINEALQLGISKKLPFLPRKINKGSKIYLASLQIKHIKNIEGKVKHETNPVIFGEFEVDHIEFIVDEVNQVIQDKFSKRGLEFKQITKIQSRKEPRRIDGKRLSSGSIYVVNYPPDNFDEKIKERHGVFTIYNPYISAAGLNFFRGIMEFNLQDFLKWKKGKENKNAVTD